MIDKSGEEIISENDTPDATRINYNRKCKTDILTQRSLTRNKHNLRKKEY